MGNDIVDFNIEDFAFDDSIEFIMSEEFSLDDIEEGIKNGVSLSLETPVKIEPNSRGFRCGIIESIASNFTYIEEEIKAYRNSIILTSTPNRMKELLANENVFHYSTMNKHKELYSYLKSNRIKKFITTPRYLSFLMEAIDPIEDYYFIIEDMDALLRKASYRTDMENIMDYYFMFDKEKRCTYISNANVLTNPLFMKEQRNEDNNTFLPTRHISLHYVPTIIEQIDEKKKKKVCNIVGSVRETIERLPNQDKLLVFYPSVKDAKEVVLTLSSESQEECCIVCNKSGQKIAGEFYADIEANKKCLNKRIVIWATNDWDIVFKDQYHMVSVIDASKGSTLLSLKTLHQLYLLNEETTNVLTDTIIYNTTSYNPQWEDDFTALEERAEKIIQLTYAADMISQGDSSLQGIFNIAKNVVKDKAKGKISGRFTPFKLTRKDINGKSTIAYMSFDSLKQRTNLIKELYNYKDSLSKKLESTCSITNIGEGHVDITINQANAKEEMKVLQKKIKADDWNAGLEEVKEMLSTDSLSIESLTAKYKKGNSILKKLYKLMLNLYPYIDTHELIMLLGNIKCTNTIPLKNLNNAIIYWALEDEHPFKAAINKAFIVKGRYTNSQITERMIPILHYHLHKDYPKTSRKVITLFKSFLNTKRPKSEYIVYPDDRFKTHKKRIPISDNNILKLFYL